MPRAVWDERFFVCVRRGKVSYFLWFVYACGYADVYVLQSLSLSRSLHTHTHTYVCVCCECMYTHIYTIIYVCVFD